MVVDVESEAFKIWRERSLAAGLRAFHGDVERAKRSVDYMIKLGLCDVDVDIIERELAVKRKDSKLDLFRPDRLDAYRFGGDKQVDGFSDVVLKNKDGVFVRPVLDVSNSFCRSYGYGLVGSGQRTNVDCGRYVFDMICCRTSLHKEHPNMVFRHMVSHHCYNWRCPVCYYYGSAVREAGRIKQRLVKASELLGLSFEVGTVSVPERFWRSSEAVIRRESLKALVARGFHDGCLVFHPLRYRSSRKVKGVFHMAEWYPGLHFHFLAFRKDSYDTCRSCEHFNPWGSKSVKGRTGYTNHGGSACLDCEHFEGLTRRLNEKDGFIVKVFDKRGNDRIFSTALYELSHAGFKLDCERVHIVTWFGDCSYRKLKVEIEPEPLVCPECKSELVKAAPYCGSLDVVKDPLSPFYRRDCWMPLCEDGKRVHFPAVDDNLEDSG